MDKILVKKYLELSLVFSYVFFLFSRGPYIYRRQMNLIKPMDYQRRNQADLLLLAGQEKMSVRKVPKLTPHQTMKIGKMFQKQKIMKRMTAMLLKLMMTTTSMMKKTEMMINFERMSMMTLVPHTSQMLTLNQTCQVCYRFQCKYAVKVSYSI